MGFCGPKLLKRGWMACFGSSRFGGFHDAGVLIQRISIVPIGVSGGTARS